MNMWLDHEVAVRIVFVRHVGGKPNRARLVAGDAHNPPARMEAPEIPKCVHVGFLFYTIFTGQ